MYVFRQLNKIIINTKSALIGANLIACRMYCFFAFPFVNFSGYCLQICIYEITIQIQEIIFLLVCLTNTYMYISLPQNIGVSLFSLVIEIVTSNDCLHQNENNIDRNDI